MESSTKSLIQNQDENPLIIKGDKELESTLYAKYRIGGAEIYIFGKSKDKDEDIFDSYRYLSLLLKNRGISTLFIPNTSTFNGIISKPTDFIKGIEFNGIKIMNGVETEGLIIPKKSAALIFSADNPTVICQDGSNIIAFNAGLKSLFDRQKVVIGVTSRDHDSVIDDVMKNVENPKELKVLITCGIKASSYKYYINDPLYKKTNISIFDYFIKKHGKDAIPFGSQKGNLNLDGIIIEQFVRKGVDPINIQIDNIDTFSDPNLYSHYKDHSHGVEDTGQNKVLIINN